MFILHHKNSNLVIFWHSIYWALYWDLNEKVLLKLDLHCPIKKAFLVTEKLPLILRKFLSGVNSHFMYFHQACWKRNSRRQWKTGKPGTLWSMGPWRVLDCLAIEQQWIGEGQERSHFFSAPVFVLNSQIREFVPMYINVAKVENHYPVQRWSSSQTCVN